MTPQPTSTIEVGERSVVAVPDPRQLGVDEFTNYSLIIDARTPHEYDEDHIPGAINLPVVDDAEFAEVGTKYVSDRHAAYLVGAAYASSNLATHIRTHIAKYRPGDRLLVYCFRGGKRSRVWADTLRNIGFETETLKGGWKEYRRWVLRSLETLPAAFEYRVLASLTGCGKTRLLHALELQGNQVLDLEGLASHRGSLLGAVPGEPQPSQKSFDSLLLAKMRTFDPGKPVWLEAESKKIGNLHLPPALFEVMRRSRPLHLTAPIGERVRLLIEDYPHFAREPLTMVAKLDPLKALVGNVEFALWKSLAQDGQAGKLFERVLLMHYDPSYQRASQRSPFSANEDISLELPALTPEHLVAAAIDLTRRFGSRESHA
jgi:tRNA 2-selenouridine synthase